MRTRTLPVLLVLAALLATACGDDDPTIEQENPNYRGWRSSGDGRSTQPPGEDSSESPDTDIIGSPDQVRGPSDVQQQPTDLQESPDLPAAPDYLPADAGCVPGTKCYEDEYKIMGSMVTIVVNEEAYNPDWFLLNVLPPESIAVPITIKSNGFNQLNLVDVFLAESSNPAISFQWTTPGLPEALPLVLFPPGKGEPTQVQGTLTYAPTLQTTAEPALFTVWSSDPDHLSRVVTFKPKEQGPDIELPISAVNYGCGSYCFGQQFTIENAGNQNLTIQSTQFKTPSSEWSAQGPAPGTVLPPKGSPGYAPISLTIDYCDADGNYNNDTNEYLIFSNDPDENPVGIHLTVMLPSDCP